MSKIDSRGALTRVRSLHGVVVACILSAALAACGGDGGDDGTPTGGGGSGTTPTPSLSLSASAATINASGQNVSLTATLTHSSATPTWTLSGPGSLSATSGTAVSYIPPDSEDDANDVAATATVTVSAGGLTQQTQIALAATVTPGHHWTVAAPPSQSWLAVANGGGMFVAVGEDGAIASSPDGVTWTHHDTPGGENWGSVLYRPTGWLVPEPAASSLLTSPDGVTWTQSPAPAGAANFGLGVAAYGNGITVVLGGSGSIVSTDGTTWTALDISGRAIAFGNGTFVVAVGDGHTLSSTDGVHWTSTMVSTSDPGSVAFANGHFLLGATQSSYVSTDGRTWTSQGNTPDGIEIQSLTAIGGTIYALEDGFIGMTTDGITWTSEFALTGPLQGIAAGGGVVVVVSLDGSIGSGPDAAHLGVAVPPGQFEVNSADYADGLYLLGGEGGVASSADGKSWTPMPLNPGNGMNFEMSRFSAIAHAPDGTVVIAGDMVGSDGYAPATFAWSADGQHWTFASAPASTDPDVDDFGQGPVIHDGRRFISVGVTGDIHSSPTGRVWSTDGFISVPVDATVAGLAFGNGRYAVVGASGFAATSTDGVNWTPAAQIMSTDATPVPVSFSNVVYAAGKFIAVGSEGLAATSTDGLTWTVAATAAPALIAATSQAPQRTFYLYGLAVDAAGEIVAVGNAGLVETSHDGVHWTLRPTSRPEDFISVAATPDGFMIGGGFDLVEISTH